MTLSVSIITPSFNQSCYLEQAIRSVLEQEYPALEYFIIDGGSTDSSVEIIRKYQQHLTGWVSEPDKGQAEAINKGFARTSGDIVAWLNSDDVYQPGAIRTAVETFEKHPEAGMVYGNLLSIDEGSKAFNVQTFRPYTLADLMAFRIIGQPAVFLRRALLERTGLLDPSFHYLLDHHLWLRVAQAAPIVHIPRTLAAARYHSAAKNRAHTREFGREAFRIVEWMQFDPRFSPFFNHHRRRILAGAHRLNAFYLLDGGFYAESLTAYARAFWYHPVVVLPETHRILYALLAPLGLHRLRAAYNRLRSFTKLSR